MAPLHLLLALLAPLSATPAQTSRPEPVPVLIVSGANNHWWQWTTPSLRSMLEESGKFRVEVTETPAETLADRGALARFRAVVLDYNGPRWGEAAEASFLDAVRAGLGVVVVHAANNAFPGWKEYEDLVALCWREGTGHGRFHAFDVKVTDRDHPITRDLADLVAHPDELYHALVHMHGAPYRVLATAHSSIESGGTGKDEPMAVVREYGRGRVFHTPLGHVWPGNEAQQASHRSPGFRDLVVRGTEWAATGDVTPSARPANTLTEAERAAGWSELFDGRSTRGWVGFRTSAFPERGWQVVDGALRHAAGGGGGDLVTERTFRDFEFAFEWKVAPGANSGVMYRVGDRASTTWQSGPEFQVLDDAAHPGADPRHTAGSLYDLYVAEGKTLNPAGAWNHGRILVVGNYVEHWVNGRRVVVADLASEEGRARIAASKFGEMPDFARLPAGRIALQDHGDEVHYRNLFVRDLSPDPRAGRALFQPGLPGWTAYLQEGGKQEDVWSLGADGVLVCKGRPIGYLRTTEDFTNFHLRLEWRFDPAKGAGNSGVLMRQVGPDQVWPRSIEAQLMSGQAGDFWNIGEFPMRADPARTNGRNTRRVKTHERELGEWNEYDILVWRGHVVLRVNGEILNEARDALEIPGKLCLQSEGAEIHFRDLRLTTLP